MSFQKRLGHISPGAQLRAGSWMVPGTLFVAAGLIGLPATPSRSSRAPTTEQPGVMVSVAWLAQHSGDRRLRLFHVDFVGDSGFRVRHIPGAQFLSLDSIVVGADRSGNHLELPAPARLRAVLERLGVSDSSWVVLYGSPAWAVARAFFTLDYLGLPHVSVLNGGLTTWTAEGHAVSVEVPSYESGTLTVRPRPAVVDAQWVKGHLNDPHIVLFDTRTDSEYDGTALHRGLAIKGHIPGARHVLWQALVVDTLVPWHTLVGDASDGDLALRDSTTLLAYFRERAGPSDSLITYCHVGARASISYLVARYLGYPVRLYDGSYEDWATRGYPLRASSHP